MPTLVQLPLLAIIPAAYVSACGILSALLAYPLSCWMADVSAFHSLVSRGGLVLLVLGLFPLARRLGVNRHGLGLTSGRILSRQIGVGLALGCAMLILHIVALLILEIRMPDPSALIHPYRLGKTMLQALGTGLIVAGIEETVFRGVLFSLLRARGGLGFATWTSGFYYSALHFLRSDWEPGGAGPEWNSGFRVLADAGSHLFSAPLDSLLALWVAGLFLARIRTRFPLGLGYCIGIHAGWIFVIKSAKALTDSAPPGAYSHWVGSYDGVIGYLAAVWMGLLTLGLFLGNHSNLRKDPGGHAYSGRLLPHRFQQSVGNSGSRRNPERKP